MKDIWIDFSREIIGNEGFTTEGLGVRDAKILSFSATKHAYYFDFCCVDLLTYLRVWREILRNFSVFCVN